MIEAIVGILGTSFLAALGWVFNLGNRITILETRKEDLVVLLDTKFDEVNRRLERIEKAMNGALKGHESWH